MQKTENYNLNQWEPSDSIRRSDFNSDNAAIDAAIKAVADTAAGKANAESVNALQQSVNETAAANCLVKLTELTTTAAASYVDVDLSAFDLSQYRGLEVYVENYSCTASNSGLALVINGDSSNVYISSQNANTTYTYFDCGGMTHAAQGGGHCRMTLSSSGQYLAITGTYVSGYTSDYQQLSSGEFYGFYKNGNFSALNSLRFKDTGVNGIGVSINAGMHVAVYGLKR